ncbi:hypothetical protein [Bacterioplanoides sp. SCSIO 12839]|uniref:hypothetical protein n=1 Tax=Bacterioplanoides sp. SCSIO 12839 TaxID=2829569 RepID=UPI00210683FE|nr:hypothetical protein [Bacterioplanoides sp. SCSIO 12839]UTW47779.1 hypothetical protein KFF03_14590 [Bacterioplanoides sp. SCSIO 12839]
MNTFLKSISLLLLSSIALSSQALELKLEPHNLMIFSSSVVKAKTCSKCESQSYQVTAETKFYDRNREIDFSTATEFYLRKNYPRLSLHMRNDSNELLYIVFGARSEIDPIIPLPTSTQLTKP